MTDNKAIVRQFENEFKNKANLDIVDTLMADTFVHHNPIPGIPDGKMGMKAIGQFVFGHISDIQVTIDMMIEENGLVADRISANGIRKDNNVPITWTENHLYKLKNGKIVEWWPEGGPSLD